MDHRPLSMDHPSPVCNPNHRQFETFKIRRFVLFALEILHSWKRVLANNADNPEYFDRKHSVRSHRICHSGNAEVSAHKSVVYLAASSARESVFP